MLKQTFQASFLDLHFFISWWISSHPRELCQKTDIWFMLNQLESRLYFPFFDWFVVKQNSARCSGFSPNSTKRNYVWCRINRKYVITIWMLFEWTRFWIHFSLWYIGNINIYIYLYTYKKYIYTYTAYGASLWTGKPAFTSMYLRNGNVSDIKPKL